MFAILVQRAYSDLDSPDIGIDEFEALVDFAEKRPEIVSDSTRDELIEQFGPFSENELDSLDDFEPDEQLGIYDQLESIANRLGHTLRISRDSLLEDLEYPLEDEDDSRFAGPIDEREGGMSDEDLDSMFDSLRHA